MPVRVKWEILANARNVARISCWHDRHLVLNSGSASSDEPSMTEGDGVQGKPDTPGR